MVDRSRAAIDAPTLVLASGSPRRAQLLARLGMHPELRPADVDETQREREAPTTMTERLAVAKASASAARGTGDEIVLGADTVVVLDRKVLGKPADDAEAAAMLRSLAGRTHAVVTGVAVVRGEDDLRYEHVTTRVTFRALSDAEIAWYVRTGEPRDKAGAYGLQGAGAVFVERVDGSDTNVIGLPLPTTVALLRELGLDVLRG